MKTKKMYRDMPHYCLQRTLYNVHQVLVKKKMLKCERANVKTLKMLKLGWMRKSKNAEKISHYDLPKINRATTRKFLSTQIIDNQTKGQKPQKLQKTRKEESKWSWTFIMEKRTLSLNSCRYTRCWTVYLAYWVCMFC